MPYTNVPEKLWDKMDRCVEQVQKNQPELDKENAVAICYDSVVDSKSLHTISMSLTKVSQLSDGRVRWRARANSGLVDSREERCDVSMFQDFSDNFWREMEVLSRGGDPGDPPVQLDVAHYSFYLPIERRLSARVGWPIKVWVDGQALMMQGLFDETQLGQAAAKAVLSDDDDRIRVSIGFYPDWQESGIEDGVFVYRGGRGRARLDHLALTAHPVDLEAEIVAGGVEMSDELTLKQDALDVLGNEELVNELDGLAAAKSEVPEGAVIKADESAEEAPQGEQPDEQPAQGTQPAEPEDWMDTLSEAGEQEAEEEAEGEEAESLSELDVTKAVADVLKPFLAQLSGAIDKRLDEMDAKLSELPEIRSQVKALAADDAAKVQAALNSDDGDWLTQMLRSTAQHEQVVKGGEVEEAKDSDYAVTFGNPS